MRELVRAFSVCINMTTCVVYKDSGPRLDHYHHFHSMFTEELNIVKYKVSKGVKIRIRYNQVPHLTQDTNWKVKNSQQTPQVKFEC